MHAGRPLHHIHPHYISFADGDVIKYYHLNSNGSLSDISKPIEVSQKDTISTNQIQEPIFPLDGMFDFSQIGENESEQNPFLSQDFSMFNFV